MVVEDDVVALGLNPVPMPLNVYADSACSVESMPSASSSSLIRKPMVFWMRKPMIEREHEGVGEHGERGDGLLEQQVEPATVEQPGLAVGARLGARRTGR